MSSFTPGPWTHDGDGNVTHSDEQPVAHVAFTAYTEGQSNARLIAAAPDMLDMLKKCHEALEHVGVWETPIGLIDRVYALIEEVEGK